MQKPSFGTRNDAVVGHWIASILFIAMAAFAFFFDGGMDRENASLELLAVAAFWIFGVLWGTHLLKPSVDVVIFEGKATVREYWLWSVRLEQFPATAIRGVAMLDETDGDGSDYFKCVLFTPAGRRIVLREGHSLVKVEAARNDLLTAIQHAKSGHAETAQE
ncbi:hypothetical protein OIU34_04315 [Pararhizobium sp. BT-229]|uniref:hypothetical protein n=1 Tax=Pararhizobium sp. BT-229 TaxID=2986923 RepID=UPI0021F6DC6F|nr:hypothetical protein [Pararhizobium sp. BT-229]MCV9961117.1 hypothetical protein [Pararhizobium sp. BT-229]